MAIYSTLDIDMMGEIKSVIEQRFKSLFRQCTINEKTLLEMKSILPLFADANAQDSRNRLIKPLLGSFPDFPSLFRFINEKDVKTTWKSRIEVARMLLQKGADVNALYQGQNILYYLFLFYKALGSLSPMDHRMIQMRQLMKEIILAGVDVNHGSPLAFAVRIDGMEEIAIILVEHGADMDIDDEEYESLINRLEEEYPELLDELLMTRL